MSAESLKTPGVASDAIAAHHTAPRRARRPRSLLVVGLGCLLAFALMGVAVGANPTAPWSQGIDDTWRAMVGMGPEAPLPESALAMFFQGFGQLPGMVVFVLILPAALIVIGRWRSALFVLAAQFAGPGLVSQLAKNLVDRPRPAADTAAGLFGPLFQVDHGSFPSGHAVSAAVVAVTIVALIPPTSRVARTIGVVVGALLAVGMVWQRTLINAHWLSDTVAGLLAGCGVGLILWWAFLPWLRRDSDRRPWFARAKARIDRA